MLKKVSKFGHVLNKSEQKVVFGGIRSICPTPGNYCPNDAAMIPVNCITDIAYCCVNNTWKAC
ncbi:MULTISPECIES: hypothetical protein [Flavobacterium]|uniref:Bacteriocin-type signal sequence-containing protein n=1 Tax=Flavobacterium jumunjinense TaxID=998845 RepID=A0ABV5GNG5_9FLAO|nr:MULTISPECIES: hypothetical protein [Flavobacterium]